MATRVSEALTDALGAAVLRLTRSEAGIRLGDEDPELVHQARVGTRRFRTILKGFDPLFAHGWSEGLREEAKGLADALGAVRDADVMLARQQEHSNSHRGIDQNGFRAVMSQLHADREAARRTLLVAMKEQRYAQLLDHMAAAAQQPQFSEQADRPGKELVDFAAQAFAKLKQAVDELDPDPQASDLHHVRILTKRSRYVAEVVVPVAGSDAARFAERAADLQDVLGELQDASVAGGWLTEFARSSPNSAFVAGKLSGIEMVAEQDARARWRGAWRRLDRKKSTSWMSG